MGVGAALVIFVLLCPRGIAGGIATLMQRIRDQRSRRAAALPQKAKSVPRS
jgi:hypothetical protein